MDILVIVYYAVTREATIETKTGILPDILH